MMINMKHPLCSAPRVAWSHPPVQDLQVLPVAQVHLQVRVLVVRLVQLLREAPGAPEGLREHEETGPGGVVDAAHVAALALARVSVSASKTAMHSSN